MGISSVRGTMLGKEQRRQRWRSRRPEWLQPVAGSFKLYGKPLRNLMARVALFPRLAGRKESSRLSVRFAAVVE
jgi:hypothetical protein